jgi:3-oxoadipate CoA-transferase alpha subunit
MLKICGSPEEAVSCVTQGSTVMIGGFGEAGQPVELIEALLNSTNVGDLTLVSNNAGSGDVVWRWTGA